LNWNSSCSIQIGGPTAPVSGDLLNTIQSYLLDDLGQFEAVIDDIYAAAKLQGIPVTTAIAEYGPGQFEINFNHVNDPIKAADQAILFKRLVKGVAEAHDLEATFMAKISQDLSGNGMHIHCSIEDDNGDNIFADLDEKHRSSKFLTAIGGLCATMEDAMALFAPHGNSYRRFVPGSYAPMAPHWGYNNRTVAMRVPLGARRIEQRIAGADANPYLVLAAMLAGIHYGMTHDIEPPQPISGNAYERLDSNNPPNWANALDDFHASEFIKTYFGEYFVKTYMAIKRNEIARYISAVPAIDYDWYLRTT
jgi:glutamine synthetase